VAARRCSIHGIDYPFHQFHCPVCRAAGLEDSTQYFSDVEPHDDWKEQCRRLVNSIEEEKEREAESARLIPVVTAQVHVRDGQMWVSAWDVFPITQKQLNDGDLFRVGQQVFEVLSYIHRRREYLVRPFSMTLSEEDLRRLADG